MNIDIDTFITNMHTQMAAQQDAIQAQAQWLVIYEQVINRLDSFFEGGRLPRDMATLYEAWCEFKRLERGEEPS